MRAILVAVALAAQVTHADAQDCQTRRDTNIVFGREARDCVRVQAVDLERSKESAADVATAALATCRPKIDVIRGDCGGDALADELTSRFHDDAIALVVQARAKRH